MLTLAAQRCQEIITTHSKSFAFAAQLLPAEARTDAAVLYAWCRRADDAVDEVPPHIAPRSLARLQRELDAVYAPTAQAHEARVLINEDPILFAFQELVHRCKLPKRYPQELLLGMQMDLEITRYSSLEQLYLYCYRVASVVGLMMCHVLKLRDERSLHNAAHLGVAMQLTNICRDVSEDWARARLYLPQDLLTRRGTLPAQGICAGAHDGRGEGLDTMNDQREGARRFDRLDLPELWIEPAQEATRELLRLADLHYERGYHGVTSLPTRAGLAIYAAGLIYQDIGRVVRERACHPHQPRAITSKRRKLALALLATLRYPARVFKTRLKGLFTRTDQRLKIPLTSLDFEQFMSVFPPQLTSQNAPKSEPLSTLLTPSGER